MSNPQTFKAISPETKAFRRPTNLVKIGDKLRVLQVGKFYAPHPGGMESHLEALCGELKRSINLEIVVASSNGSRTSEELLDGVKVTRLGKLFNLRSAPFCPQMVRKIRASKADLVHIHLPNPGAILAYLASGHRGRLVFTYHSDIIRQKLLSKVFWPVLRHALNRADAVIATSPNYVNSSPILKKFKERCRILPFAIDIEKFEQPNSIEVARIRRQYGPRIVLGVGRLVYYKGFKYLIRAMKEIDGHLIIIGDGPLHEELKREARTNGVSDRLTILKDVKDIVPYYHAADVFALSSVARSEAFGIVQLEAMACSKPVVNTSLDSGVSFVSPHDVTGLTVPPANAQALGVAIKTLLDDPELSSRYGRAGRRRVQEEFNLEMMAERTLQLYHEIISSPTRR